jgi:hypothetical protein
MPFGAVLLLLPDVFDGYLRAKILSARYLTLIGKSDLPLHFKASCVAFPT